jgi:tetratricopeptide (TPR) repeat protein
VRGPLTGDESETGENYMTLKSKVSLTSGMLAAALLVSAAAASAQTQSQSQPQSQSGQTPAPATTDKGKTGATGTTGNSMTLDDPNPAPTNEENAAYKAITDTPETDIPKRLELSAAFLEKYPNSRYRSSVYSVEVMGYLQQGDVAKMEEAGDKELQAKPDDVQVMAVMAQTIPRAISSKTPDPAKELAKAEGYAKKAIELAPTMAKPVNVTDDSFSTVKSETLAMAHSGLGLVYIRRNQYSDAVPELNQAVTIDPHPDQVNYYLLGMANAKTSHFDDSAAAYNKCAAMPGSMSETCKKGAEETKKLSQTQLSAPK